MIATGGPLAGAQVAGIPELSIAPVNDPSDEVRPHLSYKETP